MTPSERPLKEGEGGSYGDLAGRPLPAGLSILFIPALVALLARAEELKGASLAEEQVLGVRDGAMAVVAPADVAAAVVAQRGYAEVDPSRAWESWQSLRSEPPAQ